MLTSLPLNLFTPNHSRDLISTSFKTVGHTGGTLDKLESIPGFRTNLTTEDFMRQLGDIGVAITGPTDTVAPVDRRIYALRSEIHHPKHAKTVLKFDQEHLVPGT